MTAPSKAMTVEEFEEFALSSENVERRLEYIGGEIVEVVSNGTSSYIATRIIIKIGMYLETHSIIAHMTAPDGGYKIAGEDYMPDVALVLTAKPSGETWVTDTPVLVVEVISPTDRPGKVNIKVSNYLSEGIIVWLIDPDDETVQVHQSGQAVQIFGIKDMLKLEGILPDFTLPVKTIFK
ncbi:MAG: Uma2 family endonuclease [Aggregatilineales bacterium]